MRSANKRPELLAPAGDPDKLRTALHFGADAVYLAGERLGMRKASKNFSDQALEEAVALAHAKGAKVHVTLNILPHEEDFAGLDEYVRYLEAIGIDAVIVSDPGVFSIVRRLTNLEIHISTQASVTNAATVNFWHDLGAKRIVLARELSLDEIRAIRDAAHPDIELECFVHGAMCISYSGRCLLSNYMTGRDANRGDCAQACRWKYRLVEEKRPGEYFPVGEDEHGTFIMNSKDLCLLPHLPALMDAGIDSFKIEGRVKTQYYVATAVHAYREAIDRILDGSFDEEAVERLMTELRKASHRDYTTGFLFGEPKHDAQNYGSSSYIRTHEYVGYVRYFDPERKLALVEEKNRIREGDELEVFGARPGFRSFDARAMVLEDGTPVTEVNCPGTLFWMPMEWAETGDLIRRAE